ncbi:HAD-IA family hydrolase [Marine Group I thaumarchaeote]|uniref:HAD-IA family hydrolase n=1 Tax=Marine Group I thaumarchaeote TaxID=2511932 RepID=A0A7K4NK19_9ARCH|nr:MAG: HAD family hydrolase [Nitrosopumilus sp. YT1]KPU80959.1 phosphatase [Nitrosopumilus sp. PRT-SC01]NMI82890.1 HAD family hydrolase [Candidatus Nitrosopumilus sp. MTA1]NWJ20084.1 HAD-IA family hydrolase [Marine Group I thaumarchaeote]NWJ56309.1 HAD-IA family hydrolase [Marine Group I thaumarchaeote]
MTLTKKSEGIYIDNFGIDILNEIDAVIFDCDGVLIDVSKSYDRVILKTTQYALENFAKINDAIDVDFKIIDGFKSTGGFNDEVDLTYAAIISLVAAKKLEKDQTSFIFDVIKNADSSGIRSVEKYLENQVDISDIKKQLSYPGVHHENPLYQIFDQLFYGPELYQKLFKNSSNFSESGLIEQDDVILNNSLIEKLQKKFDSKIAIVTGRGKESISYSLKTLLEKFDLKNSIFLEDESRELAKPNPQSLLDSIKGMNSVSTLYVGDSMEDFIMAKKVTNLGSKTIFCGIIGTSKNPQEKLELFEQNEAMLVLDSINLLPKVLNLE